MKRLQGSHLEKSGWQRDRCAGPSSHWRGCWPLPASNRAWLCSPGAWGRDEVRAQDAVTTAPPEFRSRMAMPREQSTPLRLRGDLVSLEGEAARGTRYTHRADPPFHPGLGPPSGRWPGRSKNNQARCLVLRVSRKGNAAARRRTSGGQGPDRVVAWGSTKRRRSVHCVPSDPGEAPRGLPRKSPVEPRVVEI